MKFKKIPKEYYLTILDRLTRLEPAYLRYKRVFDDIISKFSQSYKVKDLSFEDENKIVEEIFNFGFEESSTNYINEVLKEFEKTAFFENELSRKYLNLNLNISKMVENLGDGSEIKNVNWLKEILKNKDKDPETLRKEKGLLYPVKKILLCEGETENILLEPIFRLFNFDFNKEGIYVVAAGGKNRLARKYYKMIEYLKLPFFILLDSDAVQIKRLIETKLRDTDKIYIIKKGEFEDLIPKDILIKTINFNHKNELNCSKDDFDDSLKMVENLKNISKIKGFGEYKKANFAKQLKEYIENYAVSDDFKDSEIVSVAAELTK